jgi:hypothetical protein
MNAHRRILASVLTSLACQIVTGVAFADARALTGQGTIAFSDRIAPSAGVRIEIPSERDAITPGRLGGRWLASADDGSTTVLELRPGGGFMFDAQAATTPERAYMCGDWHLDLEKGELALVAKTRKTRAADGTIELTETVRTEKYTVLAARSDVLILRGEAGTLTFHRRGA